MEAGGPDEGSETMSDGEEERQEREKRRELERQQDREDRIDRSWMDEGKPEREDS
jgi:hypothetical protein